MWGLGVLIPLLGVGALQVRQDQEEVQVMAQGNDTGRYLCRVTLEIPRLGTATGNGTLLNVTAAADGGHHTGLVWGLGWALGGTALLLGLVLLSHRRWRRDSETNIYMNTLPSLAGGPKKLSPPHTVMENSMYRGGLRGTWGPPSTPRP
ncbi:hypothetical protein AV530_009485 [Patagioenas fasciata monilis]|uniref:Uncharacterized protein n=1 Tax=Patagioenas fasciata monilis TaxID=372326 RepID=A0A1V4JZZ1_PATFA|nr:hypothetical protein AV530_009485 [Patagioenas fasciata monilis]